jgi:hypothetical protein
MLVTSKNFGGNCVYFLNAAIIILITSNKIEAVTTTASVVVMIWTDTENVLIIYLFY